MLRLIKTITPQQKIVHTLTPDTNTQLTSFFFGNLLIRIRLVEEVEKIDADKILIISKNIDESVLREKQQN
jgi:hypothetical protein